MALLIGKREAARLLGVNRPTTLEGLIRDGKIRVVSVAGRIRIPREEIDRIVREGTEDVPDSRSGKLSRPRTAEDRFDEEYREAKRRRGLT